MTLLLGTSLKVKLRYVFLRGGTYYYQRRIPQDLLHRYDGKVFKVNLNTLDPQVVIRKVEALNSKLEAEWRAMRDDSSLTAVQARESAKALLKRYQLEPFPTPNPDHLLSPFLDDLERKRVKHAKGDEDRYDDPIEDYLKPTEVVAIELLNRKPEMMLSEALDIYLDGHQRANDSKFRTYTNRIWNTLIAALGDKPFLEVSRADANSYRDYVLAKGNKTTTVRRQVNVLRAVFAVVIREKELTKPNPFEALRIAGLGEDSEKRQPFTKDQLTKLKAAVLKADDDMRWILALQSDTGMRLAEAVGLALDDIKLDAEVPHVVIQPHPWRRLKNDGTQRKVPLVGLSLWAAKRIVETAKEGQKFAFPRYTSMKGCKADTASSALNSWMEARGIPRTTHEFRHTMRDRLRAVNCPRDMAEAIGGWGGQGISDNYGEGYALETMQGWLLKVV